MAIISPSQLALAMQASLRETIAKQASTGYISLVDELMGYSLAGQLTSQYYNPKQSDVSVNRPTRKIAAPEVLTGLVKSDVA